MAFSSRWSRLLTQGHNQGWEEQNKLTERVGSPRKHNNLKYTKEKNFKIHETKRKAGGRKQETHACSRRLQHSSQQLTELVLRKSARIRKDWKNHHGTGSDIPITLHSTCCKCISNTKSVHKTVTFSKERKSYTACSLTMLQLD